MLRFEPDIRLDSWGHSGYSVRRGSLMYSLPLAANFSIAAHHFGDATMSNDYDVPETESSWRYALVANETLPSGSLRYEWVGLATGAAPFNHSGWPCVVHAVVRPLPAWGIELNAPTEPPPSPACTDPGACGKPLPVRLVPHGATDLRIGMFPLA